MENLYNINIERAILSTIFFNPIVFDQIKSSLKAEDFYLPSHKHIFEIMLENDKKELPIDEEFLKQELQKNHKFDESAMLEILTTNPLPQCDKYIKELKEKSQKRKLREISDELKNSLTKNSTLELITELQKDLERIKEEKSGDNIFKPQNTQNIEIKLPKFYLENFFPIQKNEITIISAKGGVGKSYLSLLLLSLLKSKHNLNVIGFMSEDDVGITKNRLEKLKQVHYEKLADIDILGKETRPQPFIERTNKNRLEITNYFYNFKQAMKPYDVILLDPLLSFIGDDENSNKEARFFMNLLNEWCEKENKTLLIVHHHSKGEQGGARGAGDYINACRIHYTLDYIKDDPTSRKAKLEKANHYVGKTEFDIKLFKSKNNSNLQPKIEIYSL